MRLLLSAVPSSVSVPPLTKWSKSRGGLPSREEAAVCFMKGEVNQISLGIVQSKDERQWIWIAAKETIIK